MARPDTENEDLKAQLAALQEQLEAQKSAGAPPPWLEAMLSRVTKASSQASELLASKIKPENATHRQLGPFEHPEGGIKFPKEYRHTDGHVSEFHRPEIIFAGRLMRAEECTYVEWGAVNKLSESLARSQRRIARDGKWVATVNDADTRLHISVPMKTMDDRHNLPPFLLILQELTTGARQKDQAELATEVAMLHEEVARLRAEHAA